MKTTTQTTVLLAEVLAAGMGCPVCGGGKSERARTCSACYHRIGVEVTRQVDEVIEAVSKANKGHEAALASNRSMDRGIVWGPVLAQVQITPNAGFRKTFKGNIPSYWDGQIPVSGGHASLFVFGAAENAKPGDTVTAMIELKTKVINVQRDQGEGEGKKAVLIHYLRAQVVVGVSSNVELSVGDNGVDGYIEGLPSQQISEDAQGGNRRMYSVGFVPAGQGAPVDEDLREAGSTLSEINQLAADRDEGRLERSRRSAKPAVLRPEELPEELAKRSEELTDEEADEWAAQMERHPTWQIRAPLTPEGELEAIKRGLRAPYVGQWRPVRKKAGK